VHEVVDHEPIIAIDVIQAAAIRPLVAYCPVQVGNKAGVGQSRVARPDPDKAVPLLDRIAFYAGKTANPLHGHGYGLAIATHDQSVLAANQIPIFYVAQRQRRATVRAEVFDRTHLTLGATVKRNAFATNLPAQRFGFDLVWGTGHVPSVLREHMRLVKRVTTSGIRFEQLDSPDSVRKLGQETC